MNHNLYFILEFQEEFNCFYTSKKAVKPCRGVQKIKLHPAQFHQINTHIQSQNRTEHV